MNKRLMELLEKELISLEELEEMECMEGVTTNIVSGMCDKYKNAVWYECTLDNEANYDFYVKNEEE